jgi:hypothetical protein
LLELLKRLIDGHELARHLAQQVGIGHGRVMGLAVERAVLLQVLRERVVGFDGDAGGFGDVERGQGEVGHGVFPERGVEINDELRRAFQSPDNG